MTPWISNDRGHQSPRVDCSSVMVCEGSACSFLIGALDIEHLYIQCVTTRTKKGQEKYCYIEVEGSTRLGVGLFLRLSVGQVMTEGSGESALLFALFCHVIIHITQNCLLGYSLIYACLEAQLWNCKASIHGSFDNPL